MNVAKLAMSHVTIESYVDNFLQVAIAEATKNLVIETVQEETENQSKTVFMHEAEQYFFDKIFAEQLLNQLITDYCESD